MNALPARCAAPFQWQMHNQSEPTLHYVGVGGISFAYIARTTPFTPRVYKYSVFLNWAEDNNINGAPVASIEAGMRLIETLCENALKA